MTEQFTTSNGYKVDRDGIYYTDGILSVALDHFTEQQFQALREFFRDEEDRRWRFPDKDCMVVYPEDVRFRVVDERSGEGRYIYRGELPMDRPQDRFYAAAFGYVAAHPEPKPAWHDAQPGEVWRFKSADDRRHALGWVALDGTWDVMDSRGQAVTDTEDPIHALVDGGYPEFAEPGLIAERLTPEVS